MTGRGVEAASRFSPEIDAALTALGTSPPPIVHRLQVGLAQLVLEQAPPGAALQLELARAFIEGRSGAAELLEARQDCWTHVGSLACGCSMADSASAHAIMCCLEPDADAHSNGALGEQVERVMRCGGDEAAILQILRRS
jgi:hypothetical protein